MSRENSAGAVHVAIRERVAWVLISNPPRRNALSMAMMAELSRVLRRVDEDPDVMVAVVHGDGETFVAGADISEFEAQQNSADARHEADAASAALFGTLKDLSKPLVAMIKGYCLGAGMAVALSADIRVAAPDSRFGVPAARLGIGYPAPEVHSLVSVVGPARAAEILFTGSHFSADVALAAGLLNRVVDASELEVTVADLTHLIARNAPLSVRAAKAAIRASTTIGVSELRATAEKYASLCADSADAREGQRAFLDRRDPQFTGS